jgi:hypothetical protein
MNILPYSTTNSVNMFFINVMVNVHITSVSCIYIYGKSLGNRGHVYIYVHIYI